MKQEIDFDKIEQLIRDGYIVSQKHPAVDLRILNYTPKTQFEKMWTPETGACRGLIVNGRGEIISRPFEKFFNFEEVADQIPNEPFEVYEKLDGSLGISYWIDGKMFIASRGSFTSDQAVKANKMFQNYPQDIFLPHLTYLFEIIYKENRIVVDYGDKEVLVLLAVIETKTGRELNAQDFAPFIPVVKKFDGLDNLTEILKIQEPNKEGFVIRFESGMRVKIKMEEYVRLHKILTGINARHIWEYLKDNQPLDELLNRVPDEFYKFVDNTVRNLKTLYYIIEYDALQEFETFPTRKETAEYFKTCKHTSILFAMLDKKNYSEIIWKMIKPQAARAFRCDSNQQEIECQN